MKKSVSQKIEEVREEERNKAINALNQLTLEHQETLKKAAEDLQSKNQALRQAETSHTAAIIAKDVALR